MYRISVVTLTLNSEKTLKQLLESLKKQKLPPLEVIVVDGGSTDNTIKIAAEYGCKIYIERGTRGKARNTGLRNASGEIVAFIDSDCVADRNWLYELSRSFTQEDIAGVSGKTLAYNKEKLIPRLLEMIHTHGRYATWNIAYRKRILEKIGGFDEDLHAAEDQALAWKILEGGYRIVFNEKAVVYHRHRDSLRAFLKQQFEYGKWSVIARRKYGKKYYKSLLIIILWPVLFLVKHIRYIRIHPLLPFLLTLSSIAYSLGAWRGLLCRQR